MATRIPSQSSSSSSRSYNSDNKNLSRSPQNSRRRRSGKFIAPDESFLRKWRRRVFRFLTHPAFYLPLLLLIVSAVVTVGYFWSEYSHRIDLLLNGEIFTRSAGIYAAPKSIKNGDGLSSESLVNYLKAANYVDKNANADATRGRYKVDGNLLEITPGDDAKVDAKQNYSALRVKFAKDGKSIAAIENLTTNENLKTVILEPRLLSAASGEDRERRKTVAYQDIPQNLVKAITATEDRAFFEHYGVNFRGIARALWRRYDVDDNSPIARQGGSSITQQLVKNLLLSPEKSLERKVQEAFMSIILETRLTKAEIFTLYANQIYLGQQASFSINGVGEAANAYFGKDVSALNLSESAFIAGIIRSPNRYNPYKDLQKATERRNQVLDSMVDANAVSQAEADAAKTVQLAVTPPAKRRELVDTPYFTEYAQQQLAGIVNDADALQHLRVYTSIDLDLQKSASDILKNRLAKLDRYFPKKAGELNAALVAIRPKTGEIVAMVGGRDYLQSQFNRATDAQRQPGSVFKPFVYAAAINTAYDPTPRVITTATVFKDEAKTFTFNNDSYKPNNYGDFFSNKEVTVRDALVKSKNVITVDLAMELNVGKVMNLAAKAGLPKVPRAYPSMALGTAETTPLLMASAYTTFANNGVRTAPTIIDLVTTGDGRTVAAPLPQKTDVLRPDVNYVMVDMMKDVINRGTAADLRAWGFKNVPNKTGFAGKTGTSRDGWFAGFTPELVCVVYVGFDDGSDLGMKGSESAMPIWADFMKTALAAHPEWNGDWRMPEGIQKAEIDIQTGNVINNEIDANGAVITTQTNVDANPNPSQTTVVQTPDGESVLMNQNPASNPDAKTIPPEFRRIELFINGTVPQKTYYSETDETQTLDEQIVSPTPETTVSPISPTSSETPNPSQPIKPPSSLEQKMLEQNPMRPTTAQPSNIILQICPTTGLIAAPTCPTSRPKVFAFGTEPKQFCKPEYHQKR